MLAAGWLLVARRGECDERSSWSNTVCSKQPLCAFVARLQRRWVDSSSRAENRASSAQPTDFTQRPLSPLAEHPSQHSPPLAVKSQQPVGVRVTTTSSKLSLSHHSGGRWSTGTQRSQCHHAAELSSVIRRLRLQLFSCQPGRSLPHPQRGTQCDIQPLARSVTSTLANSDPTQEPTATLPHTLNLVSSLVALCPCSSASHPSHFNSQLSLQLQ